MIVDNLIDILNGCEPPRCYLFPEEVRDRRSAHLKMLGDKGLILGVNVQQGTTASPTPASSSPSPRISPSPAQSPFSSIPTFMDPASGAVSHSPEGAIASPPTSLLFSSTSQSSPSLLSSNQSANPNKRKQLTSSSDTSSTDSSSPAHESGSGSSSDLHGYRSTTGAAPATLDYVNPKRNRCDNPNL
jgi:hypothetical protein